MKILIIGEQSSGKSRLAQAISLAYKPDTPRDNFLIVDVTPRTDYTAYDEPNQIYTSNISAEELPMSFLKSTSFVIHINPEQKEETVEFANHLIKSINNLKK